MHHEPLYVFHGCRHEIDGQQVILINTPWSHRSYEERERIDDILARLEKKQPVIVVCMPFDPATFDFVKTMRVVRPLDWQHKIESLALASSLLGSLPIYDEDLPPRNPPRKPPEPTAVGAVSSTSRAKGFVRRWLGFLR